MIENKIMEYNYIYMNIVKFYKNNGNYYCDCEFIDNELISNLENSWKKIGNKHFGEYDPMDK